MARFRTVVLDNETYPKTNERSANYRNFWTSVADSVPKTGAKETTKTENLQLCWDQYFIWNAYRYVSIKTDSGKLLYLGSTKNEETCYTSIDSQASKLLTDTSWKLYWIELKIFCFSSECNTCKMAVLSHISRHVSRLWSFFIAKGFTRYPERLFWQEYRTLKFCINSWQLCYRESP